MMLIVAIRLVICITFYLSNMKKILLAAFFSFTLCFQIRKLRVNASQDSG